MKKYLKSIFIILILIMIFIEPVMNFNIINATEEDKTDKKPFDFWEGAQTWYNEGSTNGVVYLNDDWGNKAYKTLQTILEEDNPSGYEIVAAEPILGGDMDYSSVISNLKAAGAETAMMFCYYDSVVPFCIKAESAYPELNVVCGGNCYNETFLTVGGQDVNGCLAPTAFDAGDEDPEIQQFVKEYEEISKGSEPSNISAQAYDAMNVLLEAIESTDGELDREAIIAAVRDNKHEGLIGSCAFDENRDAKLTFFPMMAEDGKWVHCE